MNLARSGPVLGPVIPGPANGARLLSLDAGRAIAAIMVVLYHSGTEIFGNREYFPLSSFGNLFDFGGTGIDYFFVLSGFIIATLYQPEAGRVAAARGFLWRRFVRIYPVYWIVLCAVLAGSAVAPAIAAERTPGLLLSAFALIPWRMRDYGVPLTILLPAWTLYHEVLFYALFSILLVNRRAGVMVLNCWFAASAVMLFVPPASSLAGFWFAPVHLLFGFGIVGHWMFARGGSRRPGWTAAAGVALFFSASLWRTWGFWQLAFPARPLADGLGAALAVVGLAQLEADGKIRVPRVMAFLGAASYSIYLLHQPALVVLARIVKHIPYRAALPLSFWFVLLPCTAILCGALFHTVLERPLLRWLRPRTRSTPRIA